ALLPVLVWEQSWEYNPHIIGRDSRIAHLSFVMNEFAAVLNGRTPRVDFFPQYQGLLAYLLAPLFRVICLSIATYTTVLMALSTFGLLLWFGVLRRLTGDPWKALLLFVPLIWLSLLPIRLVPPNVYTHLSAFTYPLMGAIRYLGPCLTAALLSCYLQRPT